MCLYTQTQSNFIGLNKSRAALLCLSVKRYTCNRAFPFGNPVRRAFYKLFLSACSRITCKFWFKINQTRSSYCVWPTLPTRYWETMNLEPDGGLPRLHSPDGTIYNTFGAMFGLRYRESIFKSIFPIEIFLK